MPDMADETGYALAEAPQDTLAALALRLPPHLRAAADEVEERARTAAPPLAGLGPWHAAACDNLVTGRCACIVAATTVTGSGTPVTEYVADAETPQLAAYMTLWPPVVGLTVAYMLRSVAREAETYDACQSLSPYMQWVMQKRLTWAGELADQFLRETA